MKTTLFLLLALSVLSSIAACGGSPASADAASAADASADDASSDDASADASARG